MTVVGCLDQSKLLLISMRACIGACRNPKTSSVQDFCYSWMNDAHQRVVIKYIVAEVKLRSLRHVECLWDFECFYDTLIGKSLWLSYWEQSLEATTASGRRSRMQKMWTKHSKQSWFVAISLALIPFLNAGDDHKSAERLIVYLWILCKMALRLKTLSADHVVIMPDICACVIAAGQHPKLSRCGRWWDSVPHGDDLRFLLSRIPSKKSL